MACGKAFRGRGHEFQVVAEKNSLSLLIGPPTKAPNVIINFRGAKRRWVVGMMLPGNGGRAVEFVRAALSPGFVGWFVVVVGTIEHESLASSLRNVHRSAQGRRRI
ncbi:hypothetical protein SBA4_6880004 [Candidatus Sulfopaludibacter sp. SbA4]|nr:hypothetical protein SBA4_6880004 [Candidatus Sulfopaludibacter sp. SbA4]